MTMYRLLKIIPYIVLLLLTWFFLYLSRDFHDPLIQTLFLNIASSALFAVIAYLFYDLIRAVIEKHESSYISNYIKSQIEQDVFKVLYYMKKYIHGYNLNTNSVPNILEISRYSKKQIEIIISNQSYLGFIIFQNLIDIKGLFQGAINNALLVKYMSREHIINLLKVISLLSEIEDLFANERNFTPVGEDSIEFSIINGQKVNSKNEGKIFLFRKTAVFGEEIFYDSGVFEKENYSKLLKKYTLKRDIAHIIANKICILNIYLQVWLPKNLNKKDNLYKYETAKKHCLSINFFQSRDYPITEID